jgi:small subunit ribosomal protein S16
LPQPQLLFTLPFLKYLECEQEGGIVAVRIRMTRMGRRHRPYFRIVATDARQPRDGRYLEVLGSYDPMVPNTDERVKLRPDRIRYWLSVGAQPTEKVAVLLRKYLKKFEEQAAQQQTTAGTTSGTTHSPET